MVTLFNVSHYLGVDIEALGYIMIYFLRGALPWQGMVINDPKKKYDKIKQLKYDIKIEDLCAGLPPECIKFIQYARDMKFEDRQYIVPNCIEKVLCSIFGENYMELPPIEKRRSHYPAKVIFSNGDIMEFEYKHKVTLEDQ